MLTGRRPIVANIRNSYQFHEHESVDAAKAEAHRLAVNVGDGVFVVYVPVAVVRRQPLTEEWTPEFATNLGAVVHPEIDDDDDLPF